MHWLARVKYQSSDVIKITIQTTPVKDYFNYLVLYLFPKLCSYTEKIVLKLKEDVRCLQLLDKPNVSSDSVDILTSKYSRPAKM